LHWLAKLDWGDVATWLTGLFTAGSLILGFSILRADRKKQERAEAAGIHTRLIEDFSGAMGGQVRIVIGNRSNTPMFHVRVCAQPLHRRRLKQVLSELTDRPKNDELSKLKLETGNLEKHANGVLESQAGADGILELPLSRKLYDLYVEFSDINSIRWVRPVNSWKLIRYSRFMRWK
jgi:hypothetical protein